MNKKTVFVRTNRKFERIDLSELVYVESFRGYLKLVTISKVWMIQTTMLQLEKELPVDFFVRIHRSFIIAIDRVLYFDKASVTIQDEKGNKKEFEIGRNHYKNALPARVVVLGDAINKESIVRESIL